jgi:hypothetical protein
MQLRGVPIGLRCRHMSLHVDHELVTMHESLLEMIGDALRLYA